MTYNEATDEYSLASGRTFYSHRGVLGISREETDRIYEGFDGGAGSKTDFTAEERHEMAEYVIALWRAWAA